MSVPRRCFGEVTLHRLLAYFVVTWLRRRSLCLVGSSLLFQWHYAGVSRMPWVDIRRCPGFPNPILVETLFHIPIWEYSTFYPNGFSTLHSPPCPSGVRVQSESSPKCTRNPSGVRAQSEPSPS